VKLRFVSKGEIYFPAEEWLWIRPSISYVDAGDSFLWGIESNIFSHSHSSLSRLHSVNVQAANVPADYAPDNKLWVWHPTGGTVLYESLPETIPVLCLQAPDEISAYGLYLKTSFRSLEPIDVEWVVALKVLQNRFLFDPTTKGLPPFWKETLIQTRLEPHLGFLAQRARYFFLSTQECVHLYRKRWDLNIFEILETWPMNIREKFLVVIQKWDLSAQQTKEDSYNLHLLIKKLGIKPTETFLNNTFKNVEEFRTSLTRMAQPELSKLSELRIDKLRALKLPPRTTVFGDPTFEKDALKITHTPRHVRDFELFKDWVVDPVVIEKVKDLLEVYHQ